jgi:hypothetical protein
LLDRQLERHRCSRSHRIKHGDGERYQFERFDGEKCSIDIPPSQSIDHKTFRARLRDSGHLLDGNVKTLEKEINAAIKMKPKDIFIYAARTGWLPTRSGFVLQRKCIGKASEAIVGVALPSNDDIGKTTVKGSAHRWSNTVGAPAKQSSVMMLAISAAFASPLLRVLGEGAFGICLSGKKRRGKTAVTLAACSVIGLGTEEKVLTWYSTAAGLEPYFPLFNDCLFAIDDLAKLPDRSDSGRHLAIRDLAYKIATGKTKGRHPTFAPGQPIHGSSHRFILLTSNETSLRQVAESNRQSRGSGEQVRLIDIPAYLGKRPHIFDRAEGETNVDIQMRFERLREACAQNHGHVFRRYLRYLISLSDLDGKARRHRDRFVRMVSGETIGDQDLARKFGVIYAGGRLAISARLVPWTNLELRDAIVRCYQASSAAAPSDAAVSQQGRDKLRAFLRSFPTIGALREDSVGFVEKQPKANRYIVTTEAFARVFASKQEQTLVMDALLQDGWLTPSQKVNGSKLTPKKQFSWPDHKRVRSYEIRWPRGSSSSKNKKRRKRRAR